jgi:uncharacterized protein (TIGR03435 family)
LRLLYGGDREELGVIRVCLGFFLVVAAWAQSSVARPAFEVASIRLSESHSSFARMAGGPLTSDPTTFVARNAEFTSLLMRAYNVDDDQLKGRSGWMDTIQYDVVAKVPPGATREQFRTMLQNLLAERFRMRVHRVAEVRKVYELTVAEKGPKLKLAADGTGVGDFVPGAGPRPADRDNFPILPPGLTNVACGHFPQGSYCTFRKTKMALFAGRLSLPGFFDQRVIDKTGLDGAYDFTLSFSQLSAELAAMDISAPPIEMAVQQQLGLKLSQITASVEVIVIDQVEKTITEN